MGGTGGAHPSEPCHGGGALGPPKQLRPGTHPLGPTSALSPATVRLHGQGAQGQAQQHPQDHAQDRCHRHGPRHCRRGDAAGHTCGDIARRREEGDPGQSGMGGCRHGQSYLCKWYPPGSGSLGTGWASHSRCRCPHHKRRGRPCRGCRYAGARVPRGTARASGPPPRSPPRPARRGLGPGWGRPPASPRPRSPAAGRQRWPWRGWCRWHTRGPRYRCRAPPGARCSGCCRPPAARRAALQGGTGGGVMAQLGQEPPQGDGPPAPGSGDARH